MKQQPTIQQLQELCETAQHVVVLAHKNGKLYIVSNKLGHIEDLALCVKAQSAIESQLQKSQN
jgi:hypothetical protein